jgi:hypothetical protein
MHPKIISVIVLLMDLFVGSFLQLNEYINNQILKLKNYLGDKHYIQFAFYDIHQERMMWIYNYDNIFYLLMLWIDMYLSNIYKYLIPYGKICYLNKDQIVVGSYMNNGKQLYEFGNPVPKQNPAKFIYCIVNNDYDVTKEFELFKTSIFANKTLSCKDVLIIIQLFFDRNYKVLDNIELKLVMDDTFSEITFKGKDLLILNGI